MSTKTVKKTNASISGLLDIIAPQAIEFKPMEIQFGDQMARVLLITDYPPRVNPAWLSRIANMPGVVCSMHVLPTDPYDLIQGINKSIGELVGRLQQGGNALLMQRSEQQYNDATELLKKIDQEQQNVFYCIITLMITAKDKDTLDRRSKSVESALAGSGMRGRVAMFRQNDALKCVGPWGIIPVEIEQAAARNMPSETVAAAFPFTSSGINDRSGFILGRDKKGGIILIDIWKRGGDRTNSNWTILGKPGMGKSTAVKKVLLNQYAQGYKVIIIDPEREYQTCCERIGGSWIDCGGGLQGSRINPLQVKLVPMDRADPYDPKDTDDTNNVNDIPTYTEETASMGPLALHIHTLRTFFKMYLKDLSDFDLAVMEETLEELYKSKGITWTTDPATIPNEEWPIIKEQWELHKKKSEDQSLSQKVRESHEKFAYLLRSAAIGADSALWSGYTTINADSDFIVLDVNSLQEADEKIKRAQYFNILTWAWNEISRNRKEKVLLAVDECYLLIDPDTPQALQFLRNTSKRIRKYDGGLLVISQNVNDFLDPAVARYGQALLDNPCYKLLLAQGDKDLEGLCKLMNLSEHEQEMLAKGKRGEALLVAGSKRVHAIIELSEMEPEYFGEAGGA